MASFAQNLKTIVEMHSQSSRCNSPGCELNQQKDRVSQKSWSQMLEQHRQKVAEKKFIDGFPNYVSIEEQERQRQLEAQLSWTTKLTSLNLSHCKMQCIGLTRLLCAVSSSTCLKVLNLDGNDFICPWHMGKQVSSREERRMRGLIEKGAKALGTSRSLQKLSMAQCKISCDFLKEFCVAFFMNKSLKVLNLR